MEVLHYNLDMTPESEWKIVSAGAFARDNLLYLQEAGHFISGANYYTVRKDLDSYLVKLTLSGAGILEYGGETYRLPAGSFFWIDCRAPQHYYTAPDAGQWDVLWFHFCGATAGAYYQAFLAQTQGRAAASLPVDSPVSAQMSALLALAGEDGGGLGRDLDASALMTAILCSLIHGAARQRLQPVPAVLQKVRQYLHEQYAQKITLDTLSARYNISKYHLQRSFQRYFGQSPGEYLTRLRLTRAKELLRACRCPRSPTVSAWRTPAILSASSAPARALRPSSTAAVGRRWHKGGEFLCCQGPVFAWAEHFVQPDRTDRKAL